MRDHALQELKNHSIKISKGTKVIWPLQGGRVGELNMNSVIKKYDGKEVFSVNNSVVAFIHNGRFYITPYTCAGIEVLENAGFVEECFYVPCSNGDLPQKYIKRWEELRRLAKKSYAESFEGECNEYCDAHAIHDLPEKVLSNCMMIPDEGMNIKLHGVKMNYSPVLRQNEILDETAKSKLGRYCRSKDLLIFVYRDGRTYLAKGWWLLRELNISGYQCTKDFFVPDTLKPEEIIDPALKAKYIALPKAL